MSSVCTAGVCLRQVGVLLGLAVYNGVLLDAAFPPALYKKLLALPLALPDLADLRHPPPPRSCRPHGPRRTGHTRTAEPAPRPGEPRTCRKERRASGAASLARATLCSRRAGQTTRAGRPGPGQATHTVCYVWVWESDFLRCLTMRRRPPPLLNPSYTPPTIPPACCQGEHAQSAARLRSRGPWAP